MFVVGGIDFIAVNVAVTEVSLCFRWNMGMNNFIIINLLMMKSCYDR